MLLKETVTLFYPNGAKEGVATGKIALPPNCRSIKSIGVFPSYNNPASTIISCSINDRDCIYENAIIDSGASEFNNYNELMHDVNKPVSYNSFVRVAILGLTCINHTGLIDYKVNVYIEWN